MTRRCSAGTVAFGSFRVAPSSNGRQERTGDGERAASTLDVAAGDRYSLGRIMKRSVIVVSALALTLAWATTSHARWRGSFSGIGVGSFGPGAVYPFPPYYY